MPHAKPNHIFASDSVATMGRTSAGRPLWAMAALLVAFGPATQDARAGTPMSAPVSVGDDVCDSGTNVGAPCSMNADCGGGVCGLKSRYISFVPPTGANLAIRVKLVSLPEFPSFDGAIRWVGAPVVYSNTLDPADGTFQAAQLDCDPHVQDWTGVGLLNVFGSEIVSTDGNLTRPIYEVRTATPECVALGVETCLSDPFFISTGIWADTLTPFGDSGCLQPQLNDVLTMAAFFGNLVPPTPAIKTRAQLVPNRLDPSLPVTFRETAAWLTGFVCSGYPFTGPETCPHRVPACADNVRDANEECDDGNGVPGDGCDATCKLENATAVVSLVPVSPIASFALPYPAGTTINGNKISLPSSVRRIWLEIRLSNWDPGGLNGIELQAWQMQLDSTGYSSGPLGALTPAQEPCIKDATCTVALGDGSLCDALLCRAGFTEPGPRPDAITGNLSVGPDTVSLDYRYGSFAFLPSNDSLDDGTERYVGTLVLDVPPDALGTFTIGFKEGLFETFLFGAQGLEDIIPIAEFRPAIVEINNTKSRYLSVPVPAIAPGTLDPFAIRMKIVDAPQFPASVGQIRWAGAPNVVTGAPVEGSILVSQVQCDPEVRQWVNIDNVSLYGKSVVPGATYELRTATADCVLMGGETCLSDPVMIQTAQWGDLVSPFGGSGQPNFADISGTVAAFVATPTAPSITRGDLVPETVNQVVNFSDISADVGAFSGMVYPFAGPGTCP